MTGTLVMMLASLLCTSVDVYGFYPFNTSWTGEEVNFHYYNDMKQDNPVHNFNHDFLLAMQMEAEGLVKLHFGQCYP